jgi:hypothetical protein
MEKVVLPSSPFVALAVSQIGSHTEHLNQIGIISLEKGNDKFVATQPECCNSLENHEPDYWKCNEVAYNSDDNYKQFLDTIVGGIVCYDQQTFDLMVKLFCRINVEKPCILLKNFCTSTRSQQAYMDIWTRSLGIEEICKKLKGYIENHMFKWKHTKRLFELAISGEILSEILLILRIQLMFLNLGLMREQEVEQCKRRVCRRLFVDLSDVKIKDPKVDENKTAEENENENKDDKDHEEEDN